MPKKKTGQRKKAEKQKLRQKEIRSKAAPLADLPCNASMEVNCFHSIRKQVFFSISNFTKKKSKLSVRQMPTKAKISCILLLLPEHSTFTNLCSMR